MRPNNGPLIPAPAIGKRDDHKLGEHTDMANTRLAAQVFDGMFPWSDTREGGAFWFAVQERLRALSENAQRAEYGRVTEETRRVCSMKAAVRALTYTKSQLSGGFAWHGTTEGYEYWSDLVTRLSKLQQEIDLKVKVYEKGLLDDVKV